MALITIYWETGPYHQSHHDGSMDDVEQVCLDAQPATAGSEGAHQYKHAFTVGYINVKAGVHLLVIVVESTSNGMDSGGYHWEP